MEDVAAAAGVSRALVSLVMRGSPKVSAARRQAVLEAAERLRYRPNAMARSLASSRTKTIGVLLNDLHNPFFADIAGGIEALASELGYQLLLGTGRRRPEREQTVVTSFGDYRVDGLILVSPRLEEEALVAAASRIPTVVIGRELESPELDTVVIDEPLGVRAVINYLAGLGHRDILHVTGGDGAGAAARARLLSRQHGGRGAGAGKDAAGRLHRGGGRARRADDPGRRAADRGVRRQRPDRGGDDGHVRPRRAADPGGRVLGRLRQHLHRRAAPALADDGRPAAHDGWAGRRSSC